MKQLLILLTLSFGMNVLGQCPQPFISANTTNPICPGDPVTLTVSPFNVTNGINEWRENATQTVIASHTSTITVSPTVTTTYSFYTTSSFCPPGNVMSDDFTVVVNSAPEINQVPSFDFCDWNGNPIPMTLNSSSGVCAWSEDAAGNIGTYLSASGDFSPSGPGVYSIYSTCFDGTCTIQSNIYIHVTANGGPTVTIDPVETVDLCISPGGIMLQGTANGGSCSWSEDGLGTVGTYLDLNGLFYPTEPGIYTVYYSCGTQPCITTATQDITVVSDGSWHQYSESSAANDEANDLVTDSDGNVYVIGTFVGSTTLNGGQEPDVTISTNVGNSGSFIAKYDVCANLIWVTHTNSSNQNSGVSIDIDETTGHVYALGNMDGSLQFVSNTCGTTVTGNYTGFTQLGYVLRMDMLTGCPNYIDPVSPTSYSEMTSIAVDISENAIFVGGATDIIQANSYVVKYIPSATSIGTAIWEIEGVGNGMSKVKDMAFDLSSQVLWMVGDYNNNLILFNGSSFSPSFTNSAVSDAWTAGYFDSGSFPPLFQMRTGNVMPGGQMSGNGIAVRPNGGNNVFITGAYTSSFQDVFNLGSSAILSNSGGGESAYHIMFETTNTGYWIKEVQGNNGSVMGAAVACDKYSVYFAGNYNLDGIIFNPSGVGENYIVGGTPLANNHIYSVSYDIPSGGYLWHNVTASNDPNSEHSAISIATGIDDDKSYIVGSFENSMNYLNGTPASGPLSSSGIGTNAFVMRNDKSSGAFKNSETANINLEEEDSRFELSALVAPNPNSGLTQLIINEFDSNNSYTATLFNLLGEIVDTFQVKQERIEIDLTTIKDGIYIIKLSDGSSSVTIRVVKGN